MKKFKLIAIILCAVALVGVAAGVIFHRCFIVIDGNVYSRSETQLDLSGKPATELSKLPQLTALQQLDLRNTGLTVEEYEQLRAALPGCSILWELPFQGQYLPLDTTHITISQLTPQDISLLAYLPELKTVDALDCRDYDRILELKDSYPSLEVHYQLALENDHWKQDATFFASASLEHIRTALKYLPGLEQVDASGCTDFEELLTLAQEYPNCAFSYQVPFCGAFWPEDTVKMDLQSTRAEDLATVLQWLPAVSEITVAEPIPDPSIMAELVQAYPHIDFTFSFPIFDTVAGNHDAFLDLSGTQMTDTAELEALLPLFTDLEKVDMCGCGISNEDMWDLNQGHPDTLFVWEVQLGKHLIRTDITYFMPYQYRYQVTDADADTLKYFTELICIDLGHMDISRTDYLAYMPKMQYLLMCDTPITDISYCALMKDLKYAELFMTNVKDFSPLLECKNLVDLNICYTYPEDPMIFAQMTQLENLWFRGELDHSIRQALREALPNTRMLFGPGSSTGRGWRRLPNYYAMRDLLGMPYMEEP